MKCQKCGATLLGGHLYCDVCGAEYQIVPDFEPELEISMAKSLSGLSESIQEKEKEPVPDIQEKKSLEKRRRGRLYLSTIILRPRHFLSHIMILHITSASLEESRQICLLKSFRMHTGLQIHIIMQKI